MKQSTSGVDMKSHAVVVLMVSCTVMCFTFWAHAGTLYSNSFETDTTDWTTVERVASGTDGITSADGSFHAIATNGDFTRWGGYNYGAGNAAPTVFQEYITSIDIFLNVDGGYGDNTRFDFSSAINNASGTHLRDFIFNAAFYSSSSSTAPGAGSNRFIISASNNSQPGSAYAANPAKNPIAITTTGWYTFEHHFYENGLGDLAVDMRILNSSNSVVGSWTLTSTSDDIGLVGGNRYGWFDYSQFTGLAIDNAYLMTVSAPIPEPMTVSLLGLAVAGMAGRHLRRRAMK